MHLKKIMRFLFLLLCAGLLATVLRSGGIVPSQPAIVHTLTPASTCHMRMIAYDNAPGNGWKEHDKFISVNSGTDYTYLYDEGWAYITYNDSSNGGWSFDSNSYWLQPSSLNVWNIRTRWTWFNQTFTSGDWVLWYPC
jgi:hypothetical protein